MGIGKELEYTEGTTCSVSYGLVHETAQLYPEMFYDKNSEIRIYDVLHYLGFQVNYQMWNKNVSKHENVLIRSNENPLQCYYTDVWRGWVRNAVKEVTPEGKIIYDKHSFHELAKEYSKYEVLQPTNLSDYIDEEDLLFIDDFGGKSPLSECMKMGGM